MSNVGGWLLGIFVIQRMFFKTEFYFYEKYILIYGSFSASLFLLSEGAKFILRKNK